MVPQIMAPWPVIEHGWYTMAKKFFSLIFLCYSYFEILYYFLKVMFLLEVFLKDTLEIN